MALDERGAAVVSDRAHAFDALFASNLLEAEVRATLARERITAVPALLDRIAWVFPDRPLGGEIARVLRAGYLRGPDAWHLACALLAAESHPGMTFLTLDARQRAIAAKLGFAT